MLDNQFYTIRKAFSYKPQFSTGVISVARPSEHRIYFLPREVVCAAFRRRGQEGGNARTLLFMTGEKVVATNREAYHNYHILETFECGLALTGTEVKSIREGRCNLKDSYGLIRQGEAWLLNAHISPYSHGNRENHDPTRTRKLLLHKSEIDKLAGKAQEKGLTLVPTRMYFKNGRIKIELAIAKGKKLYDKRETERRREADREARVAMKERSKGF
jgi:SsrA-binding protein